MQRALLIFAILLLPTLVFADEGHNVDVSPTVTKYVNDKRGIVVTSRSQPEIAARAPVKYFPDPYKSSCRAYGAFRDGLTPNLPDGPQEMRYRTNNDGTIMFTWKCPLPSSAYDENSVKYGFVWFCCSCKNSTAYHDDDVKDESGNRVSRFTIEAEEGQDYAWSVSCRYGNYQSVPKGSHFNLADRGKSGEVLDYRYYSGTYATSMADEIKTSRKNADEELIDNRKALYHRLGMTPKQSAKQLEAAKKRLNIK